MDMMNCKAQVSDFKYYTESKEVRCVCNTITQRKHRLTLIVLSGTLCHCKTYWKTEWSGKLSIAKKRSHKVSTGRTGLSRDIKTGQKTVWKDSRK